MPAQHDLCHHSLLALLLLAASSDIFFLGVFVTREHVHIWAAFNASCRTALQGVRWAGFAGVCMLTPTAQPVLQIFIVTNVVITAAAI
jgi:hypothetical protein